MVVEATAPSGTKGYFKVVGGVAYRHEINPRPPPKSE
jgi:hypothetical protein